MVALIITKKRKLRIIVIKEKRGYFMRKEKENVVKDFKQVIEQSRTRERLTDNEKNQFLDFLNNSQMANDTIKGTYEHRQMILCALYYAFLAGCGYQGGFTFRE